MRVKLVVVLVLFVALIFLGGVGYLLLGGNAAPRDASSPLGGAARGTGSVPAPGLGEKGFGTPTSPRGRGSVTLRGTVSRPAGCENDDAVIVYALEGPATLDQALRAIADAAGGSTGPAGMILDRSELGDGGSFTLEIPAGAGLAHLLAAGRFLHTPESRGAALPGTGEPLELALSCGAALRGRFLLPEGEETRSAEGIEVRLVSIRRGLVGGARRTDRTARADSAGFFEFRSLPPTASYEILASPEDLAGCRLDVEGLKAGEITEVEIPLSAGGTVTGRVVDDTGAPVAGAWVSASVSAPIGRMEYGRREARTDEDGTFRLDHLPLGSVALQADREGLLQSPVRRVEISDGRVEGGVEMVLERGGTVAGVLRWPDGQPVAGQEIRVGFDPANRFGGLGSTVGARRGAEGSGRTDGRGRFEVTGLGAGPFYVSAAARPDETSWGGAAERRDRTWTARADGVLPGTADLELELAPPRIVRGRVVDRLGAPVRRFAIHAVQLMPTGIGDLARDQRDREFTDGEGRFEIDGLEDGPWDLYALADGFGASEPHSLRLPEEAGEPIEIALAPAATVSGRVLGPGSAPVAGAEVRIDEGGPEWMPEMAGRPTRPTATSGVDGTFEIGGLSHGAVQLYARAPGFTRGRAVPVDVEPGERATGVELRLRRGGVLTGEVFGAGGRPVEDAVVQLISTEAFDFLYLQSDADGRFRAENLAPGNWQVLVLPSQERLEELVTGEDEPQGALVGEMKSDIVEIVDGEATNVVFGAPLEAAVMVTGSLTSGGEPVTRAMLIFAGEGERVMRRVRRARVDREGRYTATLDGGGTYAVAVVRELGGRGARANLEIPVEIPEVDEYELDLSLPGGRIRGRAVGPEGEPAAGVRVSLLKRGAISSATFEVAVSVEDVTGPDGTFDLDALPAGDYVLALGGMASAGLFRGTGGRTSFGRRLLPVRIGEDERVEIVQVELGPPATVRVRVVDQRGVPAAGAAIFAREIGGDLLEDVALARTDDSGVCEYDGLAAGSYTFSAHKSDLAAPESQPVEVTPGDSPEITLHLEESTFLWVRLVEGTGKPVAADVRIVDSAGRDVQGMVSLEELADVIREHGFSTSERRFGPLPPGRYEIIATRGDREVTRKVTLTGRKVRRQTLRFRD